MNETKYIILQPDTKVKKITADKAKQVLNDNGLQVTLAQAEKIKEFLYALAHISTRFWIIIICLVTFYSCTPAKKVDNRFVFVRIIKIAEQDSGYWVFFRNRSNIYKTFQYEKPDTIQPGKIVTMSRIFRINNNF